MDSFKILVCCHKKTLRMDDPYFPAILLGSDFADENLKMEFQDAFWDNMGENIAQLHPFCAELTSIYWAWKNYDKLGNPDYIGLFHYRRFFNFQAELTEQDLWKCAFFDFDESTRQRFGWNEAAIQEFCDGYDLILPHRERILDPHDWQTPATLEIHYKHAHYPEDFDVATDLIKKKHPEYTNSVERSRNSEYGHFCNMFVMTRELFFNYAQWLFDIILPLQDLLPVTDPKYDCNAQKRVLGFLGERLFNIWIDYQRNEKHVKIRETQRLTGYLSADEQMHFSSQYGLAEYKRICNASKELQVKKKHPSVDVGNAVLHPSRLEEAPAVSILVPVYNVEPYLRECIESLIHQTLTDIEMIFVNNASTDNSLSILMEYYEKDPRIVVIEHKKNEGLPGSRNTALHYVRSKYFGYIDSDDICDLSMFEKLYQKAEQLQADIVTCSVIGFFDTLDNQYLHRPLEWFGDSDRLLPLSQRPQQLMEPAAWCKLFRTSYIKGLDYFEFRPGTISWEDVPAMTSAFIQTERIATVQEALYFYRQRSAGNLSNGMTRRNTKDFISGVRDQQAILEKHHYEDEGVMSYVEEFKYLFVEWMLSKMRKKDIPYLFHHVGALFKFQDRKHLKRLFSSYPQRRFVYCAIMTRSWVFYFTCRAAYRGAKRFKNYLRRVLDIRREGCYRTFKVGPIRFRQYRKKYSDETIAWFQSKIGEYEGANAQLTMQRNALQNVNNSLEAEKKLLKESNSELEQEMAVLQGNNSVLEQKNSTLEQCRNTLEKANFTLETANASLMTANSSLESANSSLEKANRTLHDDYSQQLVQNGEQAKQIQSLSTIVETYQKETAGFYRSVWTTGWIGIWKQYYYQNYEQIDEKLEKLKRCLDQESAAEIDRLCYRNFILLPKQEESDLFLYNHWKIYTPEERKGVEHPVDEAFYRNKYSIPSDTYLETPVFRFHCGLKCLPAKITEQIAGKDVIDGGAFWGDSALVLSEYKPRRIYSFEPQPETFEALQKTIADNGLENTVIPVKSGLGASEERRKLYTNGMLSGSSLTNIKPVANDEDAVVNDVDIQAIDEFVSQNGLAVGLIKLDIEGNELFSIQGAVATIKKYRPVLSISVYHNPRDLFEIKPLIEGLNLNYHFMVRKLVYHDLVTEVVLLGYSE